MKNEWNIYTLPADAFAIEVILNKGAITLLMSLQIYDEGILGKSGSSESFCQAVFSFNNFLL